MTSSLTTAEFYKLWYDAAIAALDHPLCPPPLLRSYLREGGPPRTYRNEIDELYSLFSSDHGCFVPAHIIYFEMPFSDVRQEVRLSIEFLRKARTLNDQPLQTQVDVVVALFTSCLSGTPAMLDAQLTFIRNIQTIAAHVEASFGGTYFVIEPPRVEPTREIPVEPRKKRAKRRA